jgi:hypothetical protein
LFAIVIAQLSSAACHLQHHARATHEQHESHSEPPQPTDAPAGLADCMLMVTCSVITTPEQHSILRRAATGMYADIGVARVIYLNPSLGIPTPPPRFA